jgi:hypothetical protein
MKATEQIQLVDLPVRQPSFATSQGVPLTLLDLGAENKSRGSLDHFLSEVRKVSR